MCTANAGRPKRTSPEKKPGKGPTFTFTRRLSEGLGTDEARRRCEEAFRALGEAQR